MYTVHDWARVVRVMRQMYGELRENGPWVGEQWAEFTKEYETAEALVYYHMMRELGLSR